MTRQAIINKTIEVIGILPDEKAEKISDFADFLRKQYENKSVTDDIQAINPDTTVFDFLKTEEELYTIEDLKELYNG